MLHSIAAHGAESPRLVRSRRCQASSAVSTSAYASPSTITLTEPTCRSSHAALRLLQPDRTISCVHGEQIPAAVDLSMNVLVAQTAFDSHRNVHGNAPIAGVQIDVGGEGL